MLSMFTIQGLFGAQLPTIYECDFEDEAQNAEWRLMNGNMASQIPHAWVIDTASANGGQKGLYISPDNGKTAAYLQSASYTIAYTDITLRDGEYDLSFDWRAMGYTDSLYVAWVPDRDGWGDSIYILSNLSTTIAAELRSYLLDFSDNSYGLNSSATWKTAVVPIKADGKHRRLAFIWLTSGSNTIANPGACIDNVLIIDSKACPPPTDLDVQRDGTKVKLTWNGDASGYSVRAYSYMDNRWYEQTVYDTTAVFIGITEGLCDFYVRSLCGDGVVSIKKTLSEYLLYYPENHCIDYITMNEANCFVANEPVSSSMPVKDLTWRREKVDYGYSAKESRHTLHYSQSETDPRTGGALKTVPEGEIASVRLGNWDVHSEAERVQYLFRVDAKERPILVLKYAVVLEHPNESCKPNPAFLMRVLTIDGRLVSKCASADFDYKAAAEAEWEMFQPATGSDVRWKNWTTVGVDLSDYDGKTLIIQLTTNDCGAGGHYGYAYFTLGCSTRQLEGLSCGEVNTQFVAPDGFKYLWYKKNHPSEVVGHDRVLEVLPEDTCHYAVDLMFEQDSSCYFTLFACAQPYQPCSEFGAEHVPENCVNYMQFYNVSHIKETNQVTGEVTHTSTAVDDVKWEFGDGTTSTELDPIHIYPNEGGEYELKLISYLSTCTDTLVQKINIPTIGTVRDTINVQKCYGDTYTFHGKEYTESGLYTDTIPHGAWTGCDSLVTLNLNMVDTLLTHIDTLIFKGRSITIGDQKLDSTGQYRINLVAQMGCDSIVTVNLLVYEPLLARMDSVFIECHGIEVVDLPYRIYQGSTKYYSLKMEDERFEPVQHGQLTPEVIHLPIPEECPPNRYKGVVVFEDKISGDIKIPISLILNYSAEVLTQRWNDVLAVRNAEYNGGYEFTTYQWYKNGIAIDGATGSYLYVPEGLDFKAEYAAEVTRKSDNVKLFTCPVVPEKVSKEEISDLPTLVPRNTSLNMKGRGTARWFTALGVAVSAQDYNDSAIITPAASGSYVLHLTEEDAPAKTYHIVVW